MLPAVMDDAFPFSHVLGFPLQSLSSSLTLKFKNIPARRWFTLNLVTDSYGARRQNPRTEQC